ncbi:Endoplasmic oxidoreductin-1 [Wickerhamomyces ciferrii]|uniref:Endoplasmic oxidoreductin-1 n=1 Tax=Wickerhamomyces ciferrii (strain ATCC 14091 / BCRC 22168 / CBS 111 / JCM 3599 / NBRC 0793 / NRRL Y-1031 F-60-10) TaxID=1206466 RepID=K0KG74_WICCF|nr:Endoplasmic oxidoreductin-1 [Wickerhamomyces ciferrii]CCH41956.1 Endoplasmic oxidoreductin-1 [Wickerhamomyces ciferrii]
MKLITLLSLIPITIATNLFDVDSNKNINNECCDLTYNEINNINSQIRSNVHSLVQNDYFKHYQFNLDMQCPFFECQSICFSPGCQLDLDVHTNEYDYDVDEQVEKLGDINQDSFLDSLCPKQQQGQAQEEDDEWCDLDEKNGVIIDISRNPERFTGYIPTPERNIWGMIYQNQLEGECDIEQKVFFQIISGFHSSVSTHLSNEYYNNITNSWEPNLELFKFKVGDFPERIENIYFNYALVIRSLLKISPYLNEIKFNTLDLGKDRSIKRQINKIIEALPHDLQIFNEDLMFENSEIKEEFKLKFKNVTRLMDCVTCDRCRLWGKIQSTGYATALKILFESPKVLKSLKKNEIKSLFNTFDRLTKSIESIQNFNYLNLGIEPEDEVPLDKNTYRAPSLESQEDFEFEDDREEFDEVNDNKTLKSAFYQELNAVNGALKFIFNSYLNLPKNLFHIGLFKFNQWWNLFIGNKAYSQEESEEYLYKILQ